MLTCSDCTPKERTPRPGPPAILRSCPSGEAGERQAGRASMWVVGCSLGAQPCGRCSGARALEAVLLGVERGFTRDGRRVEGLRAAPSLIVVSSWTRHGGFSWGPGRG